MKVKAIAVRIIQQLVHDKRTLALMMVAPLLIMTLIYLILNDASSTYRVALVNGPEQLVSYFEDNNIHTVRMDENQAREALEKGEIIASYNQISGKPYIEIDGSSPGETKAVLAVLTTAGRAVAQSARPDITAQIHYIYGYEDLTMFDNFGSALIGFLVFFLVFLIAGISFLQERTTGTLEKLLSTPVRRWEIVAGYVLGFGFITIIQAAIISLFVVYVLDVMMIGQLWLVLLITFLTAISSLTLSILLSTAANSEFQMIQFIPIVIFPQLFFSGLFTLSPGWEMVGKVMPLYYTAGALQDVMIRGSGLGDIVPQLLVLSAFSLLFMIANTLVLKKYRRI